MPHAYTENRLVEQPAKRLFAELGWSAAQPHPHSDPLPGGEGGRGGQKTERVRVIDWENPASESYPESGAGVYATA